MKRRVHSEHGVVHIGAASAKARTARALRQGATAAERVLWGALRRKALGGLRFRRQHPLAGFIVDFYCPALKLAVEVDGSAHERRRECDALRDRAMRRLGVVVMRVRNEDVLHDCSAVCTRVLRLAARLVVPA